MEVASIAGSSRDVNILRSDDLLLISRLHDEADALREVFDWWVMVRASYDQCRQDETPRQARRRRRLARRAADQTRIPPRRLIDPIEAAQQASTYSQMLLDEFDGAIPGRGPWSLPGAPAGGLLDRLEQREGH